MKSRIKLRKNRVITNNLLNETGIQTLFSRKEIRRRSNTFGGNEDLLQGEIICEYM